jgi:hypothetical protein
MKNQTKFVLTVDANGAVVTVQRLGDDGSLSDVPVREFFSQITVSYGAFSGSGALTVQPTPSPEPGQAPPGPQGPVIHQAPPPASPEPGKTPPGPVIHQAPPPGTPPSSTAPPSKPASPPKRGPRR